MRKRETNPDKENYVYTSNSLYWDLDTIQILEKWGNIGDIMRSPKENYQEIRKISLALYETNGLFTQIINYMSQLYTFDYFIYPNHKIEVNDSDKLKSNFRLTAEWLDKFDVKETFPHIIKDLLLEGTAFYYEVETKTKVNLRKIPYEFCKISYVEDGICRYSINLSMINSSNITLFPKEIKNAYLEYASGAIKDNWYLVGNKGVAFTTDLDSSNGVPYFAFLIPNIKAMEKSKELSDVKDSLDNLKLIHQKIPLDKNDRPLFAPKVVSKFHEATKSNLPDGIAITTNPLDISSISFDKSYNQANDLVERATKETWNNSGLSNQLFNNTNNSAEALRKNVIVNQILLKDFMGYFTIYLNSKISRRWKYSMAFLATTEMNRLDVAKAYSSFMATGGSRLQSLASFGLEPLQALNLLELEQNVLDIDALMKPKEMSYTMSGEQGRPTNEDKGIIDSESGEDSKNRGDYNVR